MSLYYTLTLPEIDFVHYYIVAWLVAWYSSGLGEPTVGILSSLT